MDNYRTKVEFGFSTPAFVPPEHSRPLWRTMLFGALLALIPFVGVGVSAVYIDRRRAPGSFDVAAALRTALLQLIAIVVLVLLIWLVVTLVYGNPVTFYVRSVQR